VFSVPSCEKHRSGVYVWFWNTIPESFGVEGDIFGPLEENGY